MNIPINQDRIYTEAEKIALMPRIGYKHWWQHFIPKQRRHIKALNALWQHQWLNGGFEASQKAHYEALIYGIGFVKRGADYAVDHDIFTRFDRGFNTDL